MTEKINTKGELEAVKEKFKEQGISLSGYFEVRELFEKGNLTKSGVKKIIQKYQKKDQPEIEKAQKKKAEEKLDTAKKKTEEQQKFSPAQERVISQIINKEQQNRNQKLSQIQFGQFMREFAKHQQKNQSQSPDTTDISALQKQIKKYLATEEQTNKEYANRQRFINANKKKPKVQITSSNPQKSGSMFGKVAGATGTLLALSYFA